MNSTAEDIKAILEADSSVEIDSGIPMYDIQIGHLPAMPNEVVAIIEDLGYRHGLSLDKSEVYERTAAQILIRTNDYREGWALAHSIKDSLHGRANETWNDTFYTLIECENGPAVFDKDENQRFIFGMNFNVQRR
jgi:hypothetical protein